MDNYGFSSTQEAIDYSLKYELSDFIFNQEDINNDGIYNIEDINEVVNHLLDESQNDSSYDFNSDQNINIFDLLVLIDFIYYMSLLYLYKGGLYKLVKVIYQFII